VIEAGGERERKRSDEIKRGVMRGPAEFAAMSTGSCKTKSSLSVVELEGGFVFHQSVRRFELEGAQLQVLC
jgi:hypothetical protein